MSSMTISVLLVEDNPIHARLLQGLLSDRSDPAFAVEAVDHLAAGIQRLSTGSFDAVLDLVLPDSQEMATFERVKEAVPDMPVLVLTGLDDEGLAEEAVAAGAREYLVKTQIDGESLARSLQAAISK
jgi:glutamate dehydrogenase (NAD(P)+)